MLIKNIAKKIFLQRLFFAEDRSIYCAYSSALSIAQVVENTKQSNEKAQILRNFSYNLRASWEDSPAGHKKSYYNQKNGRLEQFVRQPM